MEVVCGNWVQHQVCLHARRRWRCASKEASVSVSQLQLSGWTPEGHHARVGRGECDCGNASLGTCAFNLYANNNKSYRGPREYWTRSVPDGRLVLDVGHKPLAVLQHSGASTVGSGICN